MPQISGPNLQENHIIETCKEEGRAVSTQETAARREWEMEHLTRLLKKQLEATLRSALDLINSEKSSASSVQLCSAVVLPLFEDSRRSELGQ
jgi:ABC-type uncharacterized transport system ATPase component